MDLGALLTAFGLIFVAELPDKTAYTVLLLASRNKPLPVFFGSCAAFLVQGFVAVALGSLFATLEPHVVRWTAEALFLGFGLWLLFTKGEEESEEPKRGARRKAFAKAFILVFIAETGDATQIGTAALVARMGSRWSVLIGATLALWSVAALAVTLGNKLGSRLPKLALRRVAGALLSPSGGSARRRAAVRSREVPWCPSCQRPTPAAAPPAISLPPRRARTFASIAAGPVIQTPPTSLSRKSGWSGARLARDCSRRLIQGRPSLPYIGSATISFSLGTPRRTSSLAVPRTLASMERAAPFGSSFASLAHGPSAGLRKS